MMVGPQGRTGVFSPMSSKYLVDLELLPILDIFQPVDLSNDALAELRAGVVDSYAALPRPDFPVLCETLEIAGFGDGASIRLLAYTPRSCTGRAGAILHIHGGGFVLGTAEIADLANRELSAQLGCRIFSVAYRLAPEYPYPTPIEDCYAALAWIWRNADDLAIDRARIGVKGESAGGGLAAALALLVRDRGEYALAFQHLIYPMIDNRTGLADDGHGFVGEYVWSRDNNVFAWSALLGALPGGAEAPPYAAAARAVDLVALPPAFIAVGALDLFLEEDLEYARRLTRAGVPVELHVYPGAFHAFDTMPTGSAIAANARRDSREALVRALRRSDAPDMRSDQ